MPRSISSAADGDAWCAMYSQISSKSCVATGDQVRASLSAFLMPIACDRDHVIDLELLTTLDFKRPQSGVDIVAKSFSFST